MTSMDPKDRYTRDMETDPMNDPHDNAQTDREMLAQSTSPSGFEIENTIYPGDPNRDNALVQADEREPFTVDIEWEENLIPPTDEQRDFAEEAANAELLANPDPDPDERDLCTHPAVDISWHGSNGECQNCGANIPAPPNPFATVATTAREYGVHYAGRMNNAGMGTQMTDTASAWRRSDDAGRLAIADLWAAIMALPEHARPVAFQHAMDAAAESHYLNRTR